MYLCQLQIQYVLQGWWWEGEEGLLRASEAHLEQLTQSICASSVLRSLALTTGNAPLMTGAAIYTQARPAVTCLRHLRPALPRTHPG